MDHKVPNARQREIITRNGIDADGVAVMEDRGNNMVLMVYRTRDMIWLSQGDRAWPGRTDNEEAG